MAVGRTDFHERKENKIDRFKARARKSTAEANQEFNKAREMGSVIPFGQPILVGHHSEGKHRALLKRIDGAHRKAHEADERAEYYQHKAESAETNHAISGDDTEAVNRLKSKLAEYEKTKDFYKAVNKAWKQDKEALYKLGLSDTDIDKLKNGMYSHQTKPFATWQLSNLNAEIRRIKQRIEELSKLDQMKEENVKFPNGEMRINTEINRIQFVFNEIPSEEIRKLLKSHGFKWSPSEKAWQRQRTINAINTTNWLLKNHFLKQ